MRVKVLSRDPEEHTRKSKHEIHKVKVNANPALHPMAAAREYKRALNAVKLEKVFAKPFVGALDGHRDGVYCMASHPMSLSTIVSGSADGEVRLWNLTTRECEFAKTLHDGFVHGVCIDSAGSHFVSVGHDKTIRTTSLDGEFEQITIVGKSYFKDVSYHRSKTEFVTGGALVQLWSPHRAEPLADYSWGVDTTNCVKFNMTETNVFASTADDRSITLFDTRAGKPIRKILMAMRSNRLAWNPMEAFNFTVANEDHNAYTFDMRRMKKPLKVHKGHVSAVMDVSYSPTGRELVTASYDKTLRIFPQDKPRAREVYHTKRMQRLFCVLWTADNKYIATGSDETNIRLWKADASESLGTQSARQRSAMRYREKLKAKFQNHPEISRIQRHRRLPKAVYRAAQEKNIILDSIKRKEHNRRLHSKQKTKAKQVVEEERR